MIWWQVLSQGYRQSIAFTSARSKYQSPTDFAIPCAWTSKFMNTHQFHHGKEIVSFVSSHYMVYYQLLPCFEWWGSHLVWCSRCPAARTGNARSRSLWRARCSWNRRSLCWRMLPSGPWNLHLYEYALVIRIVISWWRWTYLWMPSLTLQEAHLGCTAGRTVRLAGSPSAARVSSVWCQAEHNLTEQCR
jgi:hypothetical protein